MRILLSGVLLLCCALVNAATKNGFDLTGALIPENEILSGGPPRDGIPAIDQPKFERVEEAGWLEDSDRLIGIVVDGVAKAYPIQILDWHEIVNDRVGNQHYAVTYCPLCGTGMVFASNIADTALVFGVSGLLYNSDVLLYDRNSESLWSQILAKGVTGPFKGVQLPQLPSVHTTFGAWKKKHPGSLVLSRETGYDRDYGKGPYGNYEKTRRLYFEVSNKAPKSYHPKERVLGVSAGDQHRAYPFSELSANDSASIRASLGDLEFEVIWDEESQSASAFDREGKLLPTVTGFWFAWYTFYPETEVFKANR